MKILKLIIIISFLIGITGSVFADTPNNKFGIHLAQPHLEDLKKVSELVNSNGGDWGYITLVIQENDRNKDKWQEIFDLLRKYHLVPIIRLATKPEGEFWRRPEKQDAASWVDFLDSLNWVVKDRYVILFNEPNHGAEWGGEVDAFDYVQVAFEFAKKLKEKKSDFFVMLAGLDSSAPQSPPNFVNEEEFLREMLIMAGPVGNFPPVNAHLGNSSLDTGSVKDYTDNNQQSENKPSTALRVAGSPSTSDTRPNNNITIEQNNNLFDYIDGFASHSYPNPGFAGSPWDYGKKSVRTYQWELEVLRSLGVNKELPVFITETGWSADKLSREVVAENFKTAFENIWLPDNKVITVTPFVFDYQGPPFLGFSWKKFQSQEFYQQYYTVQSMTKIKGRPEIIDKGEINFDLPNKLVEHSSYHFSLKLKNSGQAIWDKNEGYTLKIINAEGRPIEYLFADLKQINPFEEINIDLYLKTNNLQSLYDRNEIVKVNFVLIKNSQKVLESKDWQFEILPLPNLVFKVNLYPKFKTEGNDFELQIFDEKEQLVYKKNNLRVKNGVGVLNNIQNIALKRRYRIVILKPYYLPQQKIIVFKKNNNQIGFERMLPLDFSRDGKFDEEDIISLFKNLQAFKLFIPW